MNININSNTICNKSINNHKFHKIKNVKFYKYQLCYPNVSIIIDNNNDNDSKGYYFILDAPGEVALGHWFYESFIFYPIIKDLCNIYPNLEIITTNSKKYVKNLFNLVNINLPIKNTIKDTNNICFFPPVITLNDLNIDIDLIQKYINLYLDYINLIIPISDKHYITLYPRQKIDNYHKNDRIIHGIEDIENNVKKYNNGLIVNTYELDNIYEQYNIIKKSKIIIVDWGSSYLFNGLISNCKIIILDNYLLSNCHLKFTSYIFLHNLIKQNNEVIIVQPKSGKIILFDDIKKYL